MKTKPGVTEFQVIPDTRPRIWTIYYLSLNFKDDFDYDSDCQVVFEIVDNNNEQILHLDLRVKTVHGNNEIVRNSKLHGSWISQKLSEMPVLGSSNEVSVTVTSKVLDVSMNGVTVLPKYPVDIARIYNNFQELNIRTLGTCMTVDMNKSYSWTLG